MNFVTRLTRSPRAFDPDRGAEAAALFPDLAPELCDLIRGTAGCSPYLKSLIEKESEWVTGALAGTPEDAFGKILDLVRTAPDAALRSVLRTGKRRAALLIGLADLGGVWALNDVTGKLTDFADLAVDRAMKAAVAAEINRGKLPGMTLDDVQNAAGMVALAMGKMGAHELNYSSDIDLIVLFDGDRYDADDYHDARASLVRATRNMAAMLSEMTAEGYVFRTDLRLRPDASVTPVCLSMDAAESYYESVGRTWERAAYIKARPAAGDLKAGAGFLDRLRPFVWRKHLDFAAIQDAHDMRLRIRAHRELSTQITLEGHNIKLGAGGIREIEFFTQTRQLIAGGRDPSLRVLGTLDGLDRLAARDWVERDVVKTLGDAYIAHREVEHRVQMVADAQTHDLPNDAQGFARLAAFMDRDETALRREMQDRFASVQDLTEGFFAPDARPAQDTMPDMPPETSEVVDRWRGYPALRTARAGEIFKRILPDILSRLDRAARPAEALEQFDAFLSRLPAGVQVFSLFAANPQLIDLIVDIAATAPALSQYLGRNAGVFDAVIGGSFFEPWPGQVDLQAALTATLDATPDYERKLDAARLWLKEWHFRIGVHHLRGLIDATRAGRQYADLAGAVLGALWGPVVAEFSVKHGPPPGRGAAVLGMGSLGAGQLSATSDLDLIVIYDADGVDASDGRRPLPARTYYARLTQSFVTALTAPMSEGRLYEVDMRLRPSGRGGPVATSLDSFRSYQMDEAWTWEHLALTRARPVAGDADVGEDVETFRISLLAKPRERDVILRDVADMRARIAEARPDPKPDKDGQTLVETKHGAGRIQDIELTAQTAALLAGVAARDTQAQLTQGEGWLSRTDLDALRQAYTLFWNCQGAARLLSGERFDFAEVGAGGSAFLLAQTGFDDVESLLKEMQDQARRAADIIGRGLCVEAVAGKTKGETREQD